MQLMSWHSVWDNKDPCCSATAIVNIVSILFYHVTRTGDTNPAGGSLVLREPNEPATAVLPRVPRYEFDIKKPLPDNDPLITYC